jgi:hypothetical protein
VRGAHMHAVCFSTVLRSVANGSCALRCAGRVDAGRRWRTIDHAAVGGGRLPGGAGVAVPGEEADEAVRQEDTVRGAEAERGEAAADEGPLRQAAGSRRRSRHDLVRR